MVKYPMLLAAVALAVALPARVGTASAEVVEQPVAFAVTHENTSLVPCTADGLAYTVRGSWVAPAGAIPDAVTVYVHGFDGGAWQFRGAGLPAYDHALAMARLGHASIAVDMVGFDASGFPDGDQSCFGAAADVSHQVVEQLRSGAYELDGGPGVAFEQVVLAGHDVGGAVVQIAAYSFGGLDGLVLLEWADQGLTPEILSIAFAARQRCQAGGEPSEDGSADHYTLFGPPNDVFADATFHKADEAAIVAFIAERNLNPCGWVPSPLSALLVDNAGAALINSPVLLVYPEFSPVFTREGREAQQARYLSSPDVETVFLDDTGHWIMFETGRQQLADAMAAWLCRQGLAAPSACTAAADPPPEPAGVVDDGATPSAPAPSTSSGTSDGPDEGSLQLPRSGGHEALALLGLAAALVAAVRRRPG